MFSRSVIKRSQQDLIISTALPQVCNKNTACKSPSLDKLTGINERNFELIFDARTRLLIAFYVRKEWKIEKYFRGNLLFLLLFFSAHSSRDTTEVRYDAALFRQQRLLTQGQQATPVEQTLLLSRQKRLLHHFTTWWRNCFDCISGKNYVLLP